MLHAMRKGVKSWVAKVLIALLVVSFAVWGIGDIFSFQPGTAVATVEEQEVTAEEYADAMMRRQSRLSQEQGRLVTLAEMRAAGIDRQVLGSLVRDAAMRAELAYLGLSAPDRAVADAIRENPAFITPTGDFSESAYRTLLSQQRMTPVEFEALTRTLIAQEMVLNSLQGPELAAPGYATRIAAYQGEARRVTVLTLDAADAEDPGTPDDATLSAYFDDRGERYREPERRFGSYLHIDVETIAEGLEADLTEEDLRAAYDAESFRFVTDPTRTVEQITFPDLGAAEEAAGRIASGAASFEEIAEERGQAGDLALGTVVPGELPDASDEAIFALEAPGVTGAVETPLGAAILRVTELTLGGGTPFEEVRDLIAREQSNLRARDKAPDIANEIDELRAAGETLAAIAARLDGQVSSGKLDGLGTDGTWSGGAPATGILSDADVLREVTVALDGEERDFVELADGSYFLVQVERVEEARVPELGDIRERVIADWQVDQRIAALEADAERIAAAIASGSGATLASMAAGRGRTVREIGPFSRSAPAPELPFGLVNEIFGAEEGEVVAAPVPDGTGVVVAEVSSVIPLDPESLGRLSEQLDRALAASIASDRQTYFVRAVERHHGVAVNAQAIEDTFSMIGGQTGGVGGGS